MSKMMRTFALMMLIFITVRSEEGSPDSKEGVKLRDEEDVDKLRDEAIAKLEVPLEKMKIKDLKQLLTDRGVTCTACSEKSQLIETVRSSIHLPIKKDHLKKINIPKPADDKDIDNILKELKKKQAEDRKLKDMLKKQGFNTDGMNFGGGMDPDMLEKVMQNIKKDKPSE